MSTLPLDSTAAKLDGVHQPVQASNLVAEDPNAGKSSYGQILKSTALVGGSQVINIAIGIVRTKATAMLLGPAGFGLAGLYMSVAQLTQNIAGLGVNQSGVRQIAEAIGTGDNERITRTAIVLSRVSWALGLLGAAVLLIFAAPIAKLTFGNYTNTGGIAILAGVVFLNLVSAGQGALLQGRRRIADFAKMSVLGALLGTVVTIPLVYLFREQGVVPALVAVAAMSLVVSWWYSRRIEVQRIHVTASQVRVEASGFLKLGFAFMASNLLTMGSAYLIRIVISNKLGLAATGYYQAAWTLGGLYVGLILQAMGADFYPRLTAVANDNDQCNRLVNEQARVSMLLAAPGILVTLTFAPLVISIFYAPAFQEAVGVLRWICLGIAIRVISWPLGYILVAKNAQRLFMLSDFLWTIAHLGLAWLLIPRFGLEGSGMAFFGAYVLNVVFNYLLATRLTTFRWSAVNISTLSYYVVAAATVFAASLILRGPALVWTGLLIALPSGLYSIRVLFKISGHKDPRFWLRGANL